MAMVGGFPGMVNRNKQTVRAPVNPMDKATVVSIFPRHIAERKHTIQPGFFELLPGSYDKPSLLVVGTSSWWREVDEDQPLLEITNSSLQVADSIVRDYLQGVHDCDMVNKMPGLFYLPGEVTIKVLKEKPEYVVLLNQARDKQKNWYLEVINSTDVLWARTNGNPRVVSDIARLACQELGIEGKDWLKNFQAANLIRCVACGALRNPQFPICSACKAIADPELAKKLNLTFAQ